MHGLIEINKIQDIPASYRRNPIGKLLEYHNLGRPFDKY